MCGYLPDDFLERAGGTSHVNHILQFHPPACQQYYLDLEVQIWGGKPFLLKVVRRQKAPVTKRLWLEDAKLIWHSNLYDI